MYIHGWIYIIWGRARTSSTALPIHEQLPEDSTEFCPSPNWLIYTGSIMGCYGECELCTYLQNPYPYRDKSYLCFGKKKQGSVTSRETLPHTGNIVTVVVEIAFSTVYNIGNKYKYNNKFSSSNIGLQQYLNINVFTDYKSSLTRICPSCKSSSFGASHLKYTSTGSMFQCLWKEIGTWWER